MAKSNFTLLFLCFVTLAASAANINYIVYFKNKNTDENVQTYFSKEGILYRTKYNIPFDERDYAIEKYYLQQLQKQGATIKNQSNWLNAVLINSNQKKIKKIKKLSFVKSIITTQKSNEKNTMSVEVANEYQETKSIETYEDNYASSFSQINLLNGEYLHEQGFKGENMIIAVCDNGFRNLNNNTAFSHIFSDKRILGTYNYVTNDSAVFTINDGSHGSNCFSFIAGIKENDYIGTATKAKYYLFHTEDDSGEKLVEEFNLATALERCSQLGVNVVSISLGYTTFDNTAENHDTTDLKKNKTPAAKAVNIAASKGMLVCVSAGNEGAKPWHYISTPADADSAFTIASVDINGEPDASSGWGLATDTRIKPNIAAVGKSAKFINTEGNIAIGSGTSYATPQIAGLSACLWQAFPTKSNWQIKTAIEQSASQYLHPDKKIGYGIPDFQKAYTILASSTAISTHLLEDDISVFPNPIQEMMNIELKNGITLKNIKIINSIGQIVFITDEPIEHHILLNNLSKGMYFLQIESNKGTVVKKIMKD
jgi:subtilisin family serine protease